MIGSGSWGCAFSRLLWQRGHRVQVLTLTAEEAVEFNRTHRNPHFLPGVELPAELEFAAMQDADLSTAGLIAYAIPTQAVREVARWAAPRPSASPA